MSLDVAERGRRIATFRFVEVRLMELAAGWIPITPEMEVKVLLGRHVWDFAQHADALGRRTFELRLPPQHSLAPGPDYLRLLEEVAGAGSTAERLGALYDVVLPGLEQRYVAYQAQSDRILDEPSLVAIERILQDSRRQRAEADALRRELGIAAVPVGSLRERESALPELVA